MKYPFESSTRVDLCFVQKEKVIRGVFEEKLARSPNLTRSFLTAASRSRGPGVWTRNNMAADFNDSASQAGLLLFAGPSGS